MYKLHAHTHTRQSMHTLTSTVWHVRPPVASTGACGDTHTSPGVEPLIASDGHSGANDKMVSTAIREETIGHVKEGARGLPWRRSGDGEEHFVVMNNNTC